MAHDVFVSYKGEDRQVAEKICDDLAKRDIKCWISSREIRAGFPHQQVIADALIDTVVMVLVFSSAANESDEILKELSIASMLKKHVIPVRIEDVFPKRGPYFYELAARQYIDLFYDWEKQIDRLAEDIKIIVRNKLDSTREKDEQTGQESMSDKEKATNDKKYLDLLQVASADGAISSSERDFLDRKASELGISSDRAKALEAQILSQIQSTAKEQWPAVGIQFLKKVQALVSAKIPFAPESVSRFEDLKQHWAASWYMNGNHHISIYLDMGHEQNLSIVWGFFSDNVRKDLLFQEIASTIEAEGVLRAIEKETFSFLPENLASIFVERPIAISDLSSEAFIHEIGRKVVEFSNSLWKVAEQYYRPGMKPATKIKTSGSMPTFEGAGQVSISDTVKFDVNTAQDNAISNLSFLRPSVAEKIISERAIKPFSSLDDLIERCSLKPHEIQRLKPLVVFGAQDESASQRMFGGVLKKSASILGGLRDRILKKSEKSKKH